jgi:hypothetical protein
MLGLNGSGTNPNDHRSGAFESIWAAMRGVITRPGRLSMLLACAALSGCGPTAEPVNWSSVEAEIGVIEAEMPSAVTPAQTGEVFALGSAATDLQRGLLEDELVGAVIEWDITVYEVDYENGFYRVFVRAKNAEDRMVLETIKTDELIRVRGRVRDIVLRMAVEVWPAVVVKDWRNDGPNEESL